MSSRAAGFPALEIEWNVIQGEAADPPPVIDRLHIVLDDFEPQAIHDLESADGWRIFFRTAQQRDRAADAIRASLPGGLTRIERIDVPDDGWAERSQSGLKAIRVGRIVVAPPWDAPSASPASDIVIEIDPSTGFGTGHHETTRLCLGLLQEMPLAGASVTDAGTGSGVLAIAAWRLGAQRVIAFDEDPDALRNARENLARNGAGEAVELVEAALGSEEPATRFEAADVVVANLTAAVLERYSEALAELVRPGGSLVVSGFAPEDLPDIEGAFGTPAEARRIEGNWAAALLRSPRTRS